MDFLFSVDPDFDVNPRGNKILDIRPLEKKYQTPSIE